MDKDLMKEFIQIGYKRGWASAQIREALICIEGLKEIYEHIDFEVLNNCLTSAQYHLDA